MKRAGQAPEPRLAQLGRFAGAEAGRGQAQLAGREQRRIQPVEHHLLQHRVMLRLRQVGARLALAQQPADQFIDIGHGQ